MEVGTGGVGMFDGGGESFPDAMSKGRKRAQYYIKTWLNFQDLALSHRAIQLDDGSIFIDRSRSSCMFVVAAIFYWEMSLTTCARDA